jgi:hypothetical protein
VVNLGFDSRVGQESIFPFICSSYTLEE